MDEQLEGKVKNCRQCQEMSMNPPPVPMQSWEWPTQPWSRLHIDYAGSFQGKMLLVVIDTPSKWIEVSIVNTATTAITILRSMFATRGFPKTVVSDNNSVFNSNEFETSLQKNGVCHI